MRIDREKREWDAVVDTALAPTGAELPGQGEIIGAVQGASGPRDVVVQAAGSLPGDLHKLWRVRDVLGYHVEYAFSAMGYEIAGGLGVKRGLTAQGDDRDVIVMVGDGSYLMLHTELVTAVAEGIKIIVVLIQNEGYASIGHLSETVGSERFGTRYRYLDRGQRNFESGELLTTVDLAANARSYGIDVIEIKPGQDAVRQLSAAVTAAKASTVSTLIHINSDPFAYAPDGEGWWDVPVAQVSRLDSTRQAYADYVEQRQKQRPLLG
jgi:3D-(3,5/4)-trihydroxycyclohexane-1,2-dione acylhydrolase (decyclizing)